MLPKHRKWPKTYDIGEVEGHAVEDIEIRSQLLYFEAMDLFINGIKDRFQQLGYQIYSKLEKLLVKSAKK